MDALRRANHPSFHNAAQLKALAGCDPDEQRQVLGLLLHANAVHQGAPFQKVTEAIAAMRGRTAPAPDMKRLNAFVGTFHRMPAGEKRGALKELAQQLPKGWVLREGEAAPAKAAFSAEHERYRDEALEAIDRARELIELIERDRDIHDRLRHRGANIRRAGAELQRARLTIAGNGFNVGGGK